MTSLEIDTPMLSGAEGQTVLITGGASGIGRAAAELFHSLGAQVLIGDIDTKLGEETTAAIGKNCKFQRCDVTSWASLLELFETAIREFGRLDIVLANAGVAEVEDIFADTIDEATGNLKEPKYIGLDINLKGVMATVKLAKHFFERQKRPGAIVMTSSTGGVTGGAYLPVYTSCKHGVIGLMRAVSSEGVTPFSTSNIRVNCVAPFMTETGFMTSELREHLTKAHVPINKPCSVAMAMVYLAVTDGVSGQIIYVANDKFTEIEGKIQALRPQWLGENASQYLENNFVGKM
ncbi:hypothetical protein LTR06_001312 [Exophiala xenobiotica]|nr:hypothetical protein LTR06_001312 [Exophiala xenobiotica]